MQTPEATRKNKRFISIPAAFRRFVIRNPNKPAIICGEQSLTYSQVDQLTETVVQRLRDAGFWPGHRIGLYQPNTSELALAYLGCLKAGVVVVQSIHD